MCTARLSWTEQFLSGALFQHTHKISSCRHSQTKTLCRFKNTHTQCVLHTQLFAMNSFEPKQFSARTNEARAPKDFSTFSMHFAFVWGQWFTFICLAKGSLSYFVYYRACLVISIAFSALSVHSVLSLLFLFFTRSFPYFSLFRVTMCASALSFEAVAFSFFVSFTPPFFHSFSLAFSLSSLRFSVLSVLRS